MTLDEAKEVAKLASIGPHTDCGYCVSDFAEEAQKLFPQFRWTMEWMNGEYPYVKVEEQDADLHTDERPS